MALSTSTADTRMNIIPPTAGAEEMVDTGWGDGCLSLRAVRVSSLRFAMVSLEEARQMAPLTLPSSSLADIQAASISSVVVVVCVVCADVDLGQEQSSYVVMCIYSCLATLCVFVFEDRNYQTLLTHSHTHKHTYTHTHTHTFFSLPRGCRQNPGGSSVFRGRKTVKRGGMASPTPNNLGQMLHLELCGSGGVSV